MCAERQPHPLASATRGGRIATADGPNVVVWDATTHASIWTHRVADPHVFTNAGLDSFRSPPAEPEAKVVGLRWVGDSLLAVDDHGRLVRLSSTGERRETVECGVAAFALLATKHGLWAVLHPRGAVVGQAGANHRSRLRYFEQAKVCCGTFADDGNFLGLGTLDGRLVVSPMEVSGVREVVVGSTLHGVAWQPRFGWVVACEDAIVRIDSNYSQVERWWVDPSEESDRPGLTGLVAGPGLCAWWRGPSEVVVATLASAVSLATIDLGELGELGEREGAQLEFGPWPWLGVARRAGGYDRVDLRTGLVDPHGASTAMVRVELDHELANQLTAPSNPPQPTRLWPRIAVLVLVLTLASLCV